MRKGERERARATGRTEREGGGFSRRDGEEQEEGGGLRERQEESGRKDGEGERG